MKKYKGYCYQVKKTDVAHRNNPTVLQYYEWNICSWNKYTRSYDILQTSDEDYPSKGDAVNAVIEHIDEYYYYPPPPPPPFSLF